MIWAVKFVDTDRPFEEGSRAKVQVEGGKGSRQVLRRPFWVQTQVQPSDQIRNLSDAIPD